MLHALNLAGRVLSATALLTLSYSALGTSEAAAAATDCAECAQWNLPQKPFRIYGNTYYVGTQGLSSILVTSDFGSVLIDGGLAESAPLIKANIEALGFSMADVKAIISSHAHFDHAGGLAQLQRMSGAPVYALRPAESVLRTGKLLPEDPQAGARSPKVEPVGQVWVVQDDQLLGVGGVRMRIIATPGHSPGGISLAWDSCEEGKCLKMFYAGSLSAVPGGRYRFKDHPEVLQQFETSFKRVEAAACEVLLTPHPEASKLLERLDPERGTRGPTISDANACRDFAAAARAALATRIAEEG